MRKIWCDKDTCKKEIKNGETVTTVFGLDLCEDCALILKPSVLKWANSNNIPSPEYTESDCKTCQ